MRRGFTLIEMIVVITILSLMAMVVFPRLLSIRESADARVARTRLITGIERARSIARERRETIIVGIDSQSRQLNLSTDQEESSRGSTLTDSQEPFEENVSIGADIQLDSIDRTNENDEAPRAASGDALTQFFADGSAQPVVATINIAGGQITLRVRGDGLIDTSSESQDSTPERWQAGDLEVRTTGG